MDESGRIVIVDPDNQLKTVSLPEHEYQWSICCGVLTIVSKELFDRL